MKKIIVSLSVCAFLFSCDPNSDKKVGNAPPIIVRGSGTGGGGATGGGSGTTGNGSSTDAPIDGGLSMLLIAGAAYGVKRFRNKSQKGVV